MTEPEGRSPASLLQFRLPTFLALVLGIGLGFVAREAVRSYWPGIGDGALRSSTSTIRPGDQIVVESMVEPALNRRVTVLSDGTVTLPFVGRVQAGGSTIPTFEGALNQKYSQFFRSPDILLSFDGTSEPLKR